MLQNKCAAITDPRIKKRRPPRKKFNFKEKNEIGKKKHHKGLIKIVHRKSGTIELKALLYSDVKNIGYQKHGIDGYGIKDNKRNAGYPAGWEKEIE